MMVNKERIQILNTPLVIPEPDIHHNGEHEEDFHKALKKPTRKERVIRLFEDLL